MLTFIISPFLLITCGFLVSRATIAVAETQCDGGSQWVGSACWCSQGFYSPDGLAPCFPCENSFNTAVGTTTCQCNAGFISVDGNAPCTPCTEFSTTYKENAALGFYFLWKWYGTISPTSGLTACTCMAGAVGVGGKAPCKQCPAGSGTYYADPLDLVTMEVPGMAECLCSAGFWSATGQSSESSPCTPCLDFTSSDIGSTSCNFCRADYFRPTAQAPCQRCPEGTTTPKADISVGISSCSKCDIGFYSSTGASPCAVCPDGFTTTG
jgi:hypothetical protein